MNRPTIYPVKRGDGLLRLRRSTGERLESDRRATGEQPESSVRVWPLVIYRWPRCFALRITIGLYNLSIFHFILLRRSQKGDRKKPLGLSSAESRVSFWSACKVRARVPCRWPSRSMRRTSDRLKPSRAGKLARLAR